MSVHKKLMEKEEETLLKEIESTERIEKYAAISWDGTNFVVRIPKEIADFLSITEENRKNKKIRFYVEEKDEKIISEITLIEKNDQEKNTK